MKLLYVSPYIPYPLTNGGSQAFFMMADYVRNHHDLSVLFYVHNSVDRNNVDELKKRWPNVRFYIYDKHLGKNNIKTKLWLDPYEGMSWLDRKICQSYDFMQLSLLRKIARKKRKYDYSSFSSRHHLGDAKHADIVRNNSTLFYSGSIDLSPIFFSYVEEVCMEGFDVIQVEFYEYLPLIYFLPQKAKKIFVHHELRFVRNENELKLFKNPQSTDLVLFEKQKSIELSQLSAYDAVVTLTTIDRDILCNYLPPEKVFVSPAITQTVSFEYKSFSPASELVFIGNGDHFPNLDGMVWLLHDVMPILLSKHIGNPKINITGRWNDKMKKGLKRLYPSIEFVGYVDDLQTFLNGKISIVPIRIGSGMRMKILDSVFAAAPIVTTSKGCEGLPVVNGENCLIADTTEEFANAVASLLSDKQLQQILAMNAQGAKTTMLDKEQLFQMRMAVYEHFRKEPSEPV